MRSKSKFAKSHLKCSSQVLPTRVSEIDPMSLSSGDSRSTRESRNQDDYLHSLEVSRSRRNNYIDTLQACAFRIRILLMLMLMYLYIQKQMKMIDSHDENKNETFHEQERIEKYILFEINSQQICCF